MESHSCGNPSCIEHGVDTHRARPARGRHDALIAAVEQRVEWAREILANDDWTDIEKIWIRRYEMDGAALARALRNQHPSGTVRR